MATTSESVRKRVRRLVMRRGFVRSAPSTLQVRSWTAEEYEAVRASVIEMCGRADATLRILPLSLTAVSIAAGGAGLFRVDDAGLWSLALLGLALLALLALGAALVLLPRDLGRLAAWRDVLDAAAGREGPRPGRRRVARRMRTTIEA